MLIIEYASAILLVVDQGADRGAQGQLVVARLFDMSAQAEDARSSTLFSAKRGIPLCSILDDGRNGCERFAVIDDGWSTIQANCCREWRLQTWITTPAFQGFHQCAFFAADISTGAPVHNDVEGKVAAQDILANIASGICFLDGLLNLSTGQGQLAAYINKGGRNAAGITGNNDSLDQLVRVFLHDHAIFEGAWLAFIGIAAEITCLVILGEEAPLHAGGETGSTATAQS